ncbi:aminoglycoside phosphotransferase family protein [Fictibacillus nanhaiensis]|uniref:fructosamine kinase family protein n=1 Tax=Fictibacillus nanhaiensis TaxID=742169 RepID=UPI001C984A6A|nr:fructosamine kinase family protein [Fictibacillus nanhaiensis]MBY6036997.1 aminoglycoside phosphotransferase family protein [Fictibacillus nanhaiensis]
MDIREIIKELSHDLILDSESIEYEQLRGGTVSKLFLLRTKDGNKYVVKSNEPQITESEAYYLNIYKNLKLLPNLHFIERSNRYLVYSFIDGSTNYERKNKQELLTTLVQEFINHYKTVPNNVGWGWADETTDSWQSFLLNRIIEANKIIKSHLKKEDYELVLNLVKKYKVNDLFIEPYLLHGDLGVHNLIFTNEQLNGVIDPTPIIGDPLYDLIYTFCSSPDDLSKHTIDSASSYLKIERNEINNLTLYENVIIGLYLRIGTCIKHHPNDLKEYLSSWYYWKNIIKKG